MKRKKEKERSTSKRVRNINNLTPYADFDGFENMFLNEVDGSNRYQMEYKTQEKSQFLKFGSKQKDKNKYKYSISPARGQ